MPPEHTREAREILGPDRALNVVLPCCLCEDARRARDVARRGLAMYLALPAYRRQWARFGLDAADLADGGSDRLVDRLVAWGGVAAIGRRIAELREAGADRIVAVPYDAEPKSTQPPWPLLEALAPAPG
jgi:probable F420-dependent oxidoreductase